MSMEDENCTAGFGADEPQRPQARVLRGGEFEGGRVPSYHGIAGETAEFDDFRDDGWSMKWPDSGEKYPTNLV